MYDIAIIGLGPACSTLARMLDKKFRIIAIDKKTDEENTGYSIQKTADKLSYALYHRMSLPGNYYSVTGEKMMHDVQLSMQNAILMRPVENMRTLIKFWKEAVTPYERLMKERNIADTKEFALQLPNVSLPDLVIPEISLKKIKHKADKKNN